MENKPNNPAEQFPMRPPPGLWSGLFAPWHGARFMMKHPRLWSLALIPIIINAVVLTIFFWISLKYFSGWLDNLLPQSQEWYWIILTYLLMVLLSIVLLLAIVFTFTVTANILASPFNDSLSAQTELLTRGGVDTPFSIRLALKEAGRTIKEEIKKAVFYLLVVALLLLLNLVPLLGSVVYSLLFSLFTMLWLGLSFLDYSLARKGYRFGDKIKYARRNIRSVFGYGLGVFIGLLIPVFNLLFIPVAVVGGTLLYVSLGDLDNIAA
jgi:CysZ protein